MEIRLFLLVVKKLPYDAVGSIITAIDGIENKEFKNAFCAVRPPGHHADQKQSYGLLYLSIM